MTGANQLPIPKAPTPGAVFVGLMPRAAALLIDMVVIYFAGYTLALGLRRPLMELGPWLPLLSTLGAFAYFWLGNGPVGGGTTFGKAILNLHVVTTVGERPGFPGYGASFRRTLLQFPLIYLALLQFGVALADPPAIAGALLDAIVRTAVIALLLKYGYSMITHPQRTPWYDLWAGTRVTSDPTPFDFSQRLLEATEGPLQRRAETHATFSRFFFVAVCLVFGLAFAPILRDPYRAANLRLIDRISEETPLESYELEGIAYQAGRDHESWRRSFGSQFVPLGEANRDHGATAGEDAATTASAGAEVPHAGLRADRAGGSGTVGGASLAEDGATSPSEPRPVLFMSWVKQWGASSPEDFDRLAAQLETLRTAASDYAIDTDAIGVKPEAPAPTRLVCLLSDRFRFVIFSPGEGLIGVIEGPMDPDQGPLTHAWYEPAP